MIDVSTYRPELNIDTMPDRIRRLPVHRGYPVPWFVDTVNGEPEFRAMNARKWKQAIADSLCWVCGEKLGRFRVCVIGPMCAINRTTSEPPCHAECAEWSARNCPFLSRPQMVRRDSADLIAACDGVEAGGFPLLRNPGVALLWWTRSFTVFRPQVGNTAMPLISLGEPDQVRWFAMGRPATRAEVIASIESGLPALRDMADKEDTPWHRTDAHAEIDRRVLAVSALYPDE